MIHKNISKTDDAMGTSSSPSYKFGSGLARPVEPEIRLTPKPQKEYVDLAVVHSTSGFVPLLLPGPHVCNLETPGRRATSQTSHQRSVPADPAMQFGMARPLEIC